MRRSLDEHKGNSRVDLIEPVMLIVMEEGSAEYKQKYYKYDSCMLSFFKFLIVST